MANFIEYKSDPSWTTFFSWCWGAVIPLLAVLLFIQGVVSWIGLVVIIACLLGVLFFLNEQVKRRSGIVTEVASGKLPKGPSKTADHTVLEFREDPFGRTALGIVFVIILLIVTTTYGTKGAWAAVGPVLVASAILLLFYLALLWASSMRLRIEGDEVQVIYPFLIGWGNRAFRFGEIALVEVRDAGWVTDTELRIVLHDGSSIRYMRWDERVIDELLGVLRRCVAEAKSAPLDWSELA